MWQLFCLGFRGPKYASLRPLGLKNVSSHCGRSPCLKAAFAVVEGGTTAHGLEGTYRYDSQSVEVHESVSLVVEGGSGKTAYCP